MEGFLPTEYDAILGMKEKGLTSVVSCALMAAESAASVGNPNASK
jgi:hypothetical protein